MKKLKVAFQGEPGAYSEMAALAFFGENIETIPCELFENVFEQVKEKKARYGLLPFENSLAGSIHRNYDLILRNEQYIAGEYYLKVQHCLMSVPGAVLSDLLQVYSHPQALAQCEFSIKKLGLQKIATPDTAGSARNVMEWKDKHKAAIASKRAAQVYDLEILAQNFEDNPSNFTRFLALSLFPFEVNNAEEGDHKTSIVFSLMNKPGSLFKALSVFALRDIDLTKIESRPIPGKPWEYLFYVDFVGHQASRNCTKAINHLEELAIFLRVLGSYPRYGI